MPKPQSVREPAATAPSSLRRLGWLLVCLIAGGLIGWAGRHFTGEPAWFLAVPLAVAIGWLFLADPTRCAAPDTRRGAAARPDDADSSR